MNKYSTFSIFLSILSALSFLIYGLLCLFTNQMKLEFQRYGLSKFRKFTAMLELLGAIGIIVGLKIKFIFLLSTAGLSLLMLFGIFARIKSNDKIISIFPAIFYFLLNFYLFFKAQ